MAVRIRLRRMGRKKQPHYRVVVADSAAPRDGRFVETLGYYRPLSEPARLAVDLERVDYWLEQGATPTHTVRSLLQKARRAGDDRVAVGEPDLEAERKARAEALAERRKAEAAAAGAETAEAAGTEEPAGEAATAEEEPAEAAAGEGEEVEAGEEPAAEAEEATTAETGEAETSAEADEEATAEAAEEPAAEAGEEPAAEPAEAAEEDEDGEGKKAE